jgi:hypothetical protein
MARTVSDQLAVARSVPALLAASAATEQFIPIEATPADAEAFLLAGLSFEAFISNLGVLDMNTPEGTVALTDQPIRSRLICPARCPAAGLGCPVCHGFPQGLWSLLCWFEPWR